MMKSFQTMLAFFALAGAIPAVGAPGAPTGSGHAEKLRIAAAEAKLSEGEVRKVDKAGGKLTIKHGPLENLDMPPMTMAFRVKEAAMLDRVKPGDRIRFLAERVNGVFTITQLEVAAP